MAHHQDRERLIIAWLHGEASRRAGWNPPEGDARTEAVQELKDIAAAAPDRRAALLAHVAGVLLGSAPADHPEAAEAAAALLIEAGADPALIDEAKALGRKRAAVEGPPFSAHQAPARRWP